MLHITILYGAIRQGRQSLRVARAIRDALQQSGQAEVTFIDIKDYELPVMEQRLKDMAQPPQSLLTISKAINTADGLVLVTPEYNGSYSGAFKNMIDYFTKEYDKKPMAIAVASDGRLGGINASHHLQHLVLSIGGLPMPYFLLTPQVQEAYDAAGHPVTEKAKTDLKHFISEVLWFFTVIQKGKETAGALPG